LNEKNQIAFILIGNLVFEHKRKGIVDVALLKIKGVVCQLIAAVWLFSS